jgi:hypothetical protein
MRLNELQDEFSKQEGKYDFIEIKLSQTDYKWIRANVCCTTMKSKGKIYFVVYKKII